MYFKSTCLTDGDKAKAASVSERKKPCPESITTKVLLQSLCWYFAGDGHRFLAVGGGRPTYTFLRNKIRDLKFELNLKFGSIPSIPGTGTLRVFVDENVSRNRRVPDDTIDEDDMIIFFHVHGDDIVLHALGND
jgi:hypothetical protein